RRAESTAVRRRWVATTFSSVSHRATHEISTVSFSSVFRESSRADTSVYKLALVRLERGGVRPGWCTFAGARDWRRRPLRLAGSVNPAPGDWRQALESGAGARGSPERRPARGFAGSRGRLQERCRPAVAAGRPGRAIALPGD